MITFGSLFAGIGGFDLGFERAGMVCNWQVEIDPFCQKVLAKHWPDLRRHSDARTFPPSNPEEWQVDGIIAGFPCQDISYAGQGAGLTGERSGLFFEAIRIIRILEPRFIVLENVAALLTRGIDQVLGTLASIGFDAEWHCIPAAHVGLPHRRDRVFIVANRDGKRKLQPSRTFTKERRRFGDRSEAIDWILSSGGILRSNDGFSAGMDRFAALGNSISPQVSEYVGRMVVEALGD